MTTAKNSHTLNGGIAALVSVEPETQAQLKQLVSGLIRADESQRLQIADQVVGMVGPRCNYSIKTQVYSEFAALIADSFLSFFLEVRSAHESEFFQFLSLLNHLPITRESPFYQRVAHNLVAQNGEDPSPLEIFNRLQMLYILTEIKDYDNAAKLYERLESLVDQKQLTLWALLTLCRARLLRQADAMEELLRLHLMLIPQAYDVDGSDCSVNFILRWILAVNWNRQAGLKKALLLRISECIGELKNLNSAMVLYELFSLEDRLVPSSDKSNYQKKLIKFPATILNVQQLHNLYFFAGYYHCGVLSHFADSIQNYQYSNYFLHKSWERLLSLSRYMRQYLEPETYYHAMPFLDARIQDLSNQVSLQNNAYVESLQANFHKIEELYERVGELSLTDSLTGLRNRRFLSDNLFQVVVLAARHRVPVCFSMMDIDFFKNTNDTFGHLAGDYILKELGRMLAGEFRKSDVVIRYGGEEFLVILFDSDAELSWQLMNEFRLKVQNNEFEFRGRLIPVTISIGIACDNNLEPQQADLSKFISRADSALYKAKASGRNKVEVYQSALSEIIP